MRTREERFEESLMACFWCLVALTVMLLIAGVFCFFRMVIDHQCYQLEPNVEYYDKTICEKYWPWWED